MNFLFNFACGIGNFIFQVFVCIDILLVLKIGGKLYGCILIICLKLLWSNSSVYCESNSHDKTWLCCVGICV